jgi:hypothetical protein
MVVYVVTVPCDDDWRAVKDLVDHRDRAGDPSKSTGEYREVANRLREKLKLADHVVLQRPGFWYVRVAPRSATATRDRAHRRTWNTCSTSASG